MRSPEGDGVSAFASKLSESSDKERLKMLALLSLERGSLMGDLIEVYEILKVINRVNKSCCSLNPKVLELEGIH